MISENIHGRLTDEHSSGFYIKYKMEYQTTKEQRSCFNPRLPARKPRQIKISNNNVDDRIVDCKQELVQDDILYYERAATESALFQQQQQAFIEHMSRQQPVEANPAATTVQKSTVLASSIPVDRGKMNGLSDTASATRHKNANYYSVSTNSSFSNNRHNFAYSFDNFVVAPQCTSTASYLRQLPPSGQFDIHSSNNIAPPSASPVVVAGNAQHSVAQQHYVLTSPQSHSDSVAFAQQHLEHQQQNYFAPPAHRTDTKAE